jgi:DtxR family Mn-dependent transcriptional regulator
LILDTCDGWRKREKTRREEKGKGLGLAEAGRTIARRTVRNHRLVEFLMKQTLNIDADEGIACGVEHHMTEEFTDALCSLLGHPRRAHASTGF